LVDAQVGMVGEAMTPTDGETPGDVLHATDHGWPSARAREIHVAYLARGDYKSTVPYRKMQRLAMRISTCSRDQAVGDREWRECDHYDEVLRPCEVDEFIISIRDLPGRRRQNLIGLHRYQGGRVFQERECRLVQVLHEEIGRHLGAALVTLDDPSPSGLTARSRQVLRCLLEGDSEKQVARRIGVSTTTVHDHVKAIYRHFRVSSRPELLAYFLHRAGHRWPDQDGA
jgi:DNA-binding CsgD family transcriptional regulator